MIYPMRKQKVNYCGYMKGPILDGVVYHFGC